jgi:hypothetical protein
MKTRTTVVTIAAALAWATYAFADLGDVVGSFRAPGTSVRGMARAGTRLHVVIYGDPTRVYRVSPANGSVYGSWETSFSRNCRGLAFSEGGYIWVGCYENDRVYKCNSVTGSVYGSWNAGDDAYGVAPYCTGDGGVNTTAILTADDNPSYCWRHNMNNGSILSSFRIRHPGFFDIAWDHRNQLVWLGTMAGSVYGYRTSGSVRASFTAPAGYPYGMAYYGQYLWVGCDGNDYIYRIHCPGTLSLEPDSFGRVKALYR